jgi:hypothetical protein
VKASNLVLRWQKPVLVFSFFKELSLLDHGLLFLYLRGALDTMLSSCGWVR